MKDKLEKYMSENRQLFDDQEPGDEIWGKIAENIEKPKVRKINTTGIIWKVAAAVIIFVASYFFHDYMQKDRKTATLAYKGKDTVYFIKRKVNKPSEPKQEQPIAKKNLNYEQKIKFITKEDAPDDNNELAEVKAYYTTQINDKENEIYKYVSFNPNIKRQIKEEFSQLDSIYNSLRKDLKENIDNKEVVEAMIQNYRIRLEILENMLKQLKGKESNETKKQRYEI